MNGKIRFLIGTIVVSTAIFALSQCITVERKPVVVVKEKEKKRPPAPVYRQGTTIVVTGVVQARGNVFLLDDDASDIMFQFAGVRFDEKAALQRSVGKHVRIQLKVTGQQGAKVLVADFVRITG